MNAVERHAVSTSSAKRAAGQPPSQCPTAAAYFAAGVGSPGAGHHGRYLARSCDRESPRLPDTTSRPTPPDNEPRLTEFGVRNNR